MTRQKAAALAKRLGCTLDYQRTEHAKHCTIYLPTGVEFDGNPGLDALHHECELDEDIWPGVIADLQHIAACPIMNRKRTIPANWKAYQRSHHRDRRRV